MKIVQFDHLITYDIVYCGSPYTKYKSGIEQAFRDVSKLMAELLRRRVQAYSPIAHTHPIAIYGNVDPLDHKIWLPFDAAIMRKSDAMVTAMMDGWDTSYGVTHEIEQFDLMRKPVYFLDPVSFEVSVRS